MKMVNYLTIVFAAFLLFACKKDNDNTPSQYEGNWKGIYSGSESGTWDITINEEGVVKGIAKSNANKTYELNGNVTNSGSFSATAGSTSTGTTFTGQLLENDANGTWKNSFVNANGVWSGTKQ
ncbi:MAG: hypothetical protein KF746_06425 [Chitinophagaceae bacterium]|nr:hypothetical protein [Chitinophagaceae bacterium]